MLDDLRSRLALPALALAVPLALAAAAYARVLHGELQFDDAIIIEHNLAVKDLGAYVRDGLVSGYLHGQRPITDLTFALNYATGRLEPWNFHLTNVLVHLGVVVLIWAFTRAILRLAGAARQEWVAVAVAGVFAVHPIQSEAVSYITQRAEALASGLYVATLLLVLTAEKRGLTRRGAPVWAAALATFVLALGAKGIVVTLPAAWLVLAAMVPSPERRAELLPWRRRLLAVLPFAALAAVFAGRALRASAGTTDAGFSVPGLPPWTYFLTQLRAIMVYLRLLFWPAGQNLDWDFRISRSVAEPAVVFSGLYLLALAAGAVALAVAARRWRAESAAAARVAGFGVLWFFLVLSVTSSFVPLSDVLVEHRLYLAGWGVFAAVAVGLERALDRVPPRWIPAAAAAGVAVAWVAPAAALHERNAVWETRRSLWSDAVSKSPLKARDHMSLAYAALHEGKLEESVRVNLVALQLCGDDAVLEVQIRRNLGAAYVLLGLLDEAEATFRRALAKDPHAADILNNLAVTLYQKRELDEAEVVARRAIAASPVRGEGWNTLGEVKLLRGEVEEALRLFERSIQLDPDVPVRHFNRGAAIGMLGRRDEACAIWANVDPANDAGLRTRLVRAWAEYGCGPPLTGP